MAYTTPALPPRPCYLVCRPWSHTDLRHVIMIEHAFDMTSHGKMAAEAAAMAPKSFIVLLQDLPDLPEDHPSTPSDDFIYFGSSWSPKTPDKLKIQTRLNPYLNAIQGALTNSVFKEDIGHKGIKLTGKVITENFSLSP